MASDVTVASSGAGLLERSAELERIAALVERALDSSGGVVLVEAPAGLGKTRLAQAAIAGGRAAELTVLSACGSELERDVPFGVVQQLFEPYLAGASTNELNGLLSGAARLAAGALSVEREATLEVAGVVKVSFTVYWKE